MVNKVRIQAMLGEVAGYTFGWNPLNLMAHVVVKVGRDKIRIPVDQRQAKYIKKEYPVGDVVELEYDRGWRIKSHAAPDEHDIGKLLNSVY